MTKQVRTHLSKADVAQKILNLQGNPYSLKDYPMFVDIFNTTARRRVMRAGRQVSKTITIAADMVTDCTLTPHHSTIYANSSGKQTASFSTSKLDPFLLHSPIIKQNLMTTKHVINNVYNKRFDNFSELKLTYFSESADRIRGSSGQSMCMDEVQDMLIDAMIDAEECLSAAQNPKFTYAGTSKSMITPLEYMWSLSTKKEWIIKCDSCNKWNRPSVENIGKQGLVCKKCGAILNTYSGHWQSFSEMDEPVYDGFWIPQIIMPLHCCNPMKWKELLIKYEQYSEHKFLNEIMGIPYGEGDSPVTEALLRSICVEERPIAYERNEESCGGAQFLIAGIDWGGGGTSGVSRTTLSIYAVYPENPEYRKVFGRIYGTGDPSKHIEDIAQCLHRFGVLMVYADHGGGNFAISQLAQLVPNIRIVPVMYTDQSKPYTWDGAANRFTVSRTLLIDSFFVDVKLGKIKCMRWDDFKPFALDILNVREEVIGDDLGKPKRVWRRYPSKPDDSLHSMVFGWFGSRVHAGHTDFTAAGYY